MGPALAQASPALGIRINELLQATTSTTTVVDGLRRDIISVASYLLRWQRHATPFGGVTTATIGRAAATIGTGHRALARVDAEWLTMPTKPSIALARSTLLMTGPVALRPVGRTTRPCSNPGTVTLCRYRKAGPVLERGLTAEQLAAEVGMAPVTRASSKVHTVGFRHTANRPARKALTHFADNSRHDDPWAADLYRRARNRGKRHPQTVRILGRGWLRIMHACFRNGTPYDPAVHHTRHATATT